MALADPQTITVNGVAKVLPRITSTGLVSVYQLADLSFALRVSHQQSGTRWRSLCRIDQRAVVTNPLDNTNDYDTQSLHIVYERPEFGFSVTTGSHLNEAMKAWYDSAMFAKIFGRES